MSSNGFNQVNAAVAAIDKNKIPSSGYLRMAQVIGDRKRGIEPLVLVSRSTIYNWINQGIFPKPVNLSRRIIAFRASDIVEWLDKQQYAD